MGKEIGATSRFGRKGCLGWIGLRIWKGEGRRRENDD